MPGRNVVRKWGLGWRLMLVGLLSGPMAWAQEASAPNLSLAPPSDTLLNLSHQSSRLGVNTFAFRSQVMGRLRPSARQDLNILLANDHVYNIALPQNPFVTQDLIFFGQYRYRFDRWYIGSGLSAQDLAANRTRLVSALGLVGLPWQARLHQGEVELRGGLWGDRRFDFQDWGPGLEAQAAYRFRSPDSTFQAGLRGLRGRYDIAPRQNQSTRLLLWGEKLFGTQALLEGGAALQQRQVEDYQLGNIQQIRSDTTLAYLNLRYGLGSNWVFRSDNRIMNPDRAFSYRPFQPSTMRQDLFYLQREVHLREELMFVGRWLSATGRLEYSQRDRAYDLRNNRNLPLTQLERERQAEKVKDITETTTAWYYSLRINPGKRHIIGANSVAQLLRVDTRSPQNTQDRDEVLYSGELYYETVWSRSFRTNLKLFGSYRHFVFIDAAQSIENFKDRVLRLEPEFKWQIGRLSWNGQYSLFVTYHVRDFAGEQDQNRANRIFLTSHQLNYRATRHWTFYTDFLRRENRLGQLNWETFQENPIDTVVIYDLTAKAQYSHASRRGNVFRYQLGYRYFRQERRALAGISEPGVGTRQITLNNITLQHGPVAAVMVSGRRSLQIQADFWFQTASIFNVFRVSDRPFVGQSQTRPQLDARQDNFFPYFSLSVFWAVGR